MVPWYPKLTLRRGNLPPLNRTGSDRFFGRNGRNSFRLSGQVVSGGGVDVGGKRRPHLMEADVWRYEPLLVQCDEQDRLEGACFRPCDVFVLF